MKEIKFIYYLDGIKTEKEAIDWNRSCSLTLKKGNEMHIKYLDTKCGMSTRHKACNSGYPHPSEKETGINMPPKISEKQASKIEHIKDSLNRSNECNTLSEIVDLIMLGDSPYSVKNIVVDGNLGLCDYSPSQKLDVGGVKHNQLKVPLDIVQTRQFPKALQLLALATSYGNHKYKNTDTDFLNFKRVEGGSQTYLDAAARHSVDRNNKDVESGLHHIIHSVWDNMAALELWAEENGIDVQEYSKEYLTNLNK